MVYLGPTQPIMKQLLTLLFIGIASLYAQTVPSYVPTNGLVGWWPFNGNANDESGNGNNGSYVTGVNPTSDRNGASNSAMGFSGQGSITLSNLPTTGSQDFTIAGWLSTSNASTARKGIACWGQDIPWQGTYFFVNPNGKLAFDFAYNAGPTSTASVNDAQWHFVSVTNNNGFIQLYVDGVPNGQGMQMSPPNISGNTKSIGSNLSGGGTQNNFAGKLDDIAIWDRALTSSEIQNIYNQINTNTPLPTYVPANGLVGWWPFNGNANDESGNGNNGSVNGALITDDRNGNQNSAYNFNVNNWSFGSGGDNIYIPYNSSFNFTEFTISAWIKRTSSGSTISPQFLSIVRRYQYGYNNPNGETWVLEIAHGTSPTGSVLYGTVIEQSPSPANNFYAQSNLTVPLNQWCHIIMTYSQNTISLYINNQLVGTASDTSININTVGNSGISIGLSEQANGQWNPFDGSIDDIGIWNRALNAQEVTALFSSSQIGVEEAMKDELTMSPNPTNGFVSLNTSVIGTYELLTLDGRVLESGTAKKDYDLTTYPKGVYHLRLSTDEGTRVLKVVKN